MSEWKFPAAVGEMAARVRDHDWAATALGPTECWPACLRFSVETMLAAHAQIVMFWGPDFIALYNDAYAPSIGNKHPAALGRPAREHWAELWSDLGPLLQSVLDTGETISAKDRPFYIERHGYPETVYFDISYSPVRDEDGRVQGVFCIVNETTERVVAQASLVESEARFSAIFAQASGGIAQTDTQGRFTLVNRRYSEITGYSQAELLGMNLRDITYPDDLPQNLELFRRLVEEGQDFTIEKRYVRKDGSLVWVSNAIGLIRSASGTASHALAVVTDITQRKRAEEIERRLAAIIASSQDAILSIDMTGRILTWNAGAEQLYGYTADEAIGQTVDMIVPEDRSDEEPQLLARINVGGRVEAFETKRRHRDGRLIDVSLSISPILDEHGAVAGASKIARDITEQKRAARLQQVLAGEMQHRIKNTFATIQAIVRQTFAGQRDTAEAVKAFEARLMSMTRAHDLLHRESWEGAELSAIVAQAVAAFDTERFNVTGPTTRLLPRAALAVSMALHELATNATKYGALSEPDGRVTITWSVTKKEPRHLNLRWKETGGPPVTEPSRTGFGSKLVRTVLAAELQGEVDVVFEPDGVACTVSALLDPYGEARGA